MWIISCKELRISIYEFYEGFMRFSNFEVPIILGRSFLATGMALVDIEKGRWNSGWTMTKWPSTFVGPWGRVVSSNRYLLYPTELKSHLRYVFLGKMILCRLLLYQICMCIKLRVLWKCWKRFKRAIELVAGASSSRVVEIEKSTTDGTMVVVRGAKERKMA